MKNLLVIIFIFLSFFASAKKYLEDTLSVNLISYITPEIFPTNICSKEFQINLVKTMIESKQNHSFYRDSISEKGFLSIIETGYAIKPVGVGMNFLKINIINGYKFNPYFYLGFGTGWYHYFNAKFSVIPLFADCRINLSNRNFSPYLALAAGYYFSYSGNKTNGLLVCPAIGFRFKTNTYEAIHFGLSYEMQKLNSYQIVYSHYDTDFIHFIGINLGYSF